MTLKELQLSLELIADKSLPVIILGTYNGAEVSEVSIMTRQTIKEKRKVLVLR